MVSSALLEGKSPRQALALVRSALEEAAIPDADYDAFSLCSHCLGQDVRLADGPLDAATAQQLAELTERRARHEPLQYLEGSWVFLDLELKVGPGVLIPRSDTETVCEAAAECLRAWPRPRALDLCSGSGCLALGLRRLCPTVQVTAVEKSPEALPYLRENLQLLAEKGFTGVTAAEGDVFVYQDSLADESLELIVSNPPYLTAGEMDELQPEVQAEPAMALFGGEDGLDFYRHISKAYKRKLVPGGVLAFEIGWQQAEAVAGLLRQNGYEQVECRLDLEGRERAVLGRRPKES